MKKYTKKKWGVRKNDIFNANTRETSYQIGNIIKDYRIIAIVKNENQFYYVAEKIKNGKVLYKQCFFQEDLEEMQKNEFYKPF